MLFVGNFRHLPNREAVEHLVNEVLPLVDPDLLARHPLRCSATGSTRPASTSAASATACSCWAGCRRSSRTCGAPGRGGAAAARRRGEAQGDAADDGRHARRDHPGRRRGPRPRRRATHALIGADAGDFAAAITRILVDDDLWARLADAGAELSRGPPRPDVVGARFRAIVER